MNSSSHTQIQKKKKTCAAIIKLIKKKMFPTLRAFRYANKQITIIRTWSKQTNIILCCFWEWQYVLGKMVYNTGNTLNMNIN